MISSAGNNPLPLSQGQQSAELTAIVKGYIFDEQAIELGVLMEIDEPIPSAPVRIPLAMVNRHGLITGATGTGKTRTLQLMAEQISAAGVPVFRQTSRATYPESPCPGSRRTSYSLARRG